MNSYDTVTYLEIARIAMLRMPDRIKDEMDLSDLEFNRLQSVLTCTMEEGLDQKQAQEEGWCVIDNGEFIEVQRNDEDTNFRSDKAARSFVMAQCTLGSAYHQQALEHVTKENSEREAGFIYMTLRSWDKDSVFDRTTVRLGVAYDPSLSPYEQEVCPTMGSNQDLVPLYHFAGTPVITWGNSAFQFTDMKVFVDPQDCPEACECGNCGKRFPIDPCTEENLMLVVIDDRKVNVAKCPHCGAIAHKPRKR